MTKRIEKAVNVLLDALRNGTLRKGDCSACAVGNLLGTDIWAEGFCTSSMGIQESFKYSMSSYEKIEYNILISESDFTEYELMLIEFVFETNTKIGSRHYLEYTPAQVRADQLKGLEAVVCAMLEFDDCKELVQEVFTSKAELIPIG